MSLGSALTAGYDGDGLRAWKNNGTTTTHFLYDGITPVCELNASGSVTATNTFGGHGLLSRNVSAGSTFYAFDPQGGVAQRLTSSDTVTGTDAYNAWGSRTSTGSGDVFGYGAQWGYYTDAETGLILCGHRYYDPARGRWLTRDPIGYAGGVDLYGYCQNEPVDQNDAAGEVLGSPGGSAGLAVCIDNAMATLQRCLNNAGASKRNQIDCYQAFVEEARSVTQSRRKTQRESSWMG